MEIESIRMYHDHEVHDALSKHSENPMMKALLGYAFPDKSNDFIFQVVDSCNSIHEFQGNIIYPALKRVLAETTKGLTTSGFENLDKNTAYLFISNHRDIVLDTSLTNLILLEKEMVMAASAIGDNLVQEEFLLAFSRMNRNFIVERSLSPREMLMSSKNLSEYIADLVANQNQSIWLAQREGRTKDGNDVTQQGILKMLSLGKPKKDNLVHYLKKLKIVPLSISYEYDPTDHLKMPALLASYKDEEYVKTKDEDFNNILTGVLGKKKRIHIAAGTPIDIQLDKLIVADQPVNQQLQNLTQFITSEIQKQYKLWPTNYIAYDMLYDTSEFKDQYTDEEKQTFEERVNKKTDKNDPISISSFLAMYAYPVLNKSKK